MNGNEHFCALFWLIFADSARDKLRKISILSVGKLVIRSVFFRICNSIEYQSLAAVKYH